MLTHAMPYLFEKLTASKHATFRCPIVFISTPLGQRSVDELSVRFDCQSLGPAEMPQNRFNINDRGPFETEIRSMAAVWEAFRSLHHFRSNRIEMDVTDEFAEVSIRLTENRFVSALEEVTDLPVFAVVILAVGGEHSLHDSVDGIVLHLNEEMKV